jgi:hypothetical protein
MAVTITEGHPALRNAAPRQTEVVPDNTAAVQMAETPVPEVKEESLSPKFAVLARKEKELVQRMRAFKQQEEAFKTREAQIREEAVKDLYARIEDKPLEVLGERGISYDKLVQDSMNQPDPRLNALERQIADLKQEIAKSKQNAEEQSKKQLAQSKTTLEQRVKELVNNNPSYETIASLQVEDAVTALIMDTYEESGAILSLEQAANEVEEYLVEEALKYASVPKIKSRLATSLETPQATKSTVPQKSMTLTNDFQPASPRKASQSESVRRAKELWNQSLIKG